MQQLELKVQNLEAERDRLATQASLIPTQQVEMTTGRQGPVAMQTQEQRGVVTAPREEAAAVDAVVSSAPVEETVEAASKKIEQHVGKISVDPKTPKDVHGKYPGHSLILSDEFTDLKHTQKNFIFEELPYGVPGNTGDINIVSTYNAEMVSLMPEGGLRLGAGMSAKSYAEFMKGWNGTFNSNWDTLPELWDWEAPKVSSRLNARFQYGIVDVRLKAPKGYGAWPAAWMSQCYGFVSEATGEFFLQDDYPFICGQFWPPELDFFEHFSPEHTWMWRPNSMSIHSPNQYVGMGRSSTPQGGYCPTSLAGPGEAWCFGVSGAGRYESDPTDRYIDYSMHWEPEGVSFYMDGEFMLRLTKDQLVLYLSGQLRPILVPEAPLFLIFNTALVRKGMDASHSGPGLTAKENFDSATGEWKGMNFDIKHVRVYQNDKQGETRGLNPPITYTTRLKLLANRVTCNLIPELRCLIKNSTDEGATNIKEAACAKLYAIGDDYCDHVEHLCSLNNAGNPEGTYGLSNAMIGNMANQHLSLVHGICCIDNHNLANEHAACHLTPKTKLPDWLLESEYFQDPKQGKEGKATGVAGTNPAGWKSYGRGLVGTEFDELPVINLWA